MPKEAPGTWVQDTVETLDPHRHDRHFQPGSNHPDSRLKHVDLSSFHEALYKLIVPREGLDFANVRDAIPSRKLPIKIDSIRESLFKCTLNDLDPEEFASG